MPFGGVYDFHLLGLSIRQKAVDLEPAISEISSVPFAAPEYGSGGSALAPKIVQALMTPAA